MVVVSQTLAAVIAGCEAAWEFFGGVFAVLVQDNLKPVIAAADAVNPQFTQGWLDYAGHAGFLTDPARVRSPKDKPRVERVVQYVRGNFWDGETYTSLDEAQQAATAWCLRTAGTRIHGSTCARPMEVFTDAEQALLLPVPGVYDVPVFKAVKVHRDFHAEVAKALYSLPEQWIGHMLDVRADSELVKFYHRGKLVKVHPRQPAGGRSTDRADLPEHKAGDDAAGPRGIDRHVHRTRPQYRDLRRTHPRRSAALDPDAHRLPTPRPGAPLRR